jgi:hypothetical protein
VIFDPPDAEVARLFDACELIVFKSIRLSNFKALSELPIHDVALWKKMKSKNALLPFDGKHPLRVWTTDAGRAKEIQAMLKKTEDEARGLMRRWFPKKKYGPEMHSWRYTITKDEPLHFDVYAERVVSPVVRFFVNLDTEPRVWDIGTTAVSKDSGTYDPGYRARINEGPVQRVSFDPGDLWIVDSSRVSHAIIYGRRAAMFSFETR